MRKNKKEDIPRDDGKRHRQIESGQKTEKKFRKDNEDPETLKEKADLQRREERKRQDEQEAAEELYDQEDMEYADGGIEDDAEDDADGGIEDEAEDDADGGIEDGAEDNGDSGIEDGMDAGIEDIDIGDLGFWEESDEEEWSDEDGWEDEEEEPAKPWITAVVFLVLIVIAAAICAALWHFSHQDSPAEGETAIQGQVSGASDQEGDVAGGGDLDQQFREPVSGTKDMEFTAVQQSVTPKDAINLRSVPDILDTDNIVAQVQNGEVLLRTGINEDTGWSEIEYEGQKLYGVTQYLTTDLAYKPAAETSNPNRVSTKDGRVVIFADCDDWISPKDYVNLRTEPSTTEGSETVSCQLNYGEKVHRTGYSPDSGWSRVEYNDQVLYVVTSLMQTAEEE